MNIKILKLNELEPIDIYKMFKLRVEVFIIEQKCLYQDIDKKDEDAYHLLSYEGDEISGYLRILKKGVSFDEVSIGRVVVNPKFRNQGVGRKIMVAGINFINEKFDNESIRISAQKYLVEFYKSLGFKVVSEDYLEDGILHVEMLK